ncbi:MAG: protein kinase family protein [Proteobacteria bacterium]|nr:protein kinase family protein [Pseudomonadota bacterium]
MDEYNGAVQAPKIAFVDPILQRGQVATNGMGIPIALGGGFALTYTVSSGGKKFAVRCFHKQAPGMQERYAKISSMLASANSNNFVGFEYQANGVRVHGSLHPIVKMDWVQGDTFGVWLEKHYKDKAAITSLIAKLRALEKFLRDKGIAHGDLQTGNILIVGSEVKLIDYDGLFVPGLQPGHGNEVGHKHFQHPQRRGSDFGPAMDRFSFIAMDISLRALTEKPDLFKKHSNGDNILFSGSDFADPSASAVFSDVRSIAALTKDVDNLARICSAPLSAIPSLEDFLAGRNIPAVIIPLKPVGKPGAPTTVGYVGAYDVIDTRDYAAALRRVGDRVELVGQIVEIKEARTRHGRPYVFVNFGPWKGSIVKLSIWSTGLDNLTDTPDQSWVGKWISVTGLLEPPYESARYSYSHISITIEEANQYRFITEAEAKRRLGSVGKSGTGATAKPSSGSNKDILKGMQTGGRTKKSRRGHTPPIITPVSPPMTKNQEILKRLGGTSGTTGQGTYPQSSSPQASSDGGFPKWLIVVGVILALIIWANLR